MSVPFLILLFISFVVFCGFPQLYATCLVFPQISWMEPLLHLHQWRPRRVDNTTPTLQLPGARHDDVLERWNFLVVYLDRATPQPKESVLGKVRIMMKCECVGPFLSTVASDVRIMGIAFLDPPSDPCLFWMKACIRTIKNDHPGLCVDDC